MIALELLPHHTLSLRIPPGPPILLCNPRVLPCPPAPHSMSTAMPSSTTNNEILSLLLSLSLSLCTTTTDADGSGSSGSTRKVCVNRRPEVGRGVCGSRRPGRRAECACFAVLDTRRVWFVVLVVRNVKFLICHSLT